MKAVNLYILEQDAVVAWSEAMDEVLGRRLVDTAHDKLANALREEILARFGAGLHKKWPASWQPDLQSIEQDLQQSKVSLERLAGNCRKLSERMAFALASECQVEVGKKPLSEVIRELAKRALVAPWILAHLDCLRALGNAAVHSGEGVTFTPPRLLPDDLLALLAALQRLLAFAESRYRSTTGGRSPREAQPLMR
jgi:hypothetical protein